MTEDKKYFICVGGSDVNEKLDDKYSWGVINNIYWWKTGDWILDHNDVDSDNPMKDKNPVMRLTPALCQDSCQVWGDIGCFEEISGATYVFLCELRIKTGIKQYEQIVKTILDL